MTRAEAGDRLAALNLAIAAAVALIRDERDTIDRFFAEADRMASVGPILDPSLFNSSERRAIEALLTPVYRAAPDLVCVYDAQLSTSREALEKVTR